VPLFLPLLRGEPYPTGPDPDPPIVINPGVILART
ncbi:uncharacterized protein METZ01_LOCUS345306, partial [marine metagenome]